MTRSMENKMNTNFKPALLLLCVAFASTATAFGQGGGFGRGRGANGASGAPVQAPMAGGRFKIYPQDAADRGLAAYNTNCGYCHGERAKGGNAGPDLYTSDVSLHDEDGVGMAAYLKGDVHQKAVKLDLPQPTVYDIAAFIHSRIIVAAINRGGDVHPDEVLKAGNAKAGEAYFNGAGKCNTCHSAKGDLAGFATKYGDAVDVQQKFLFPRPAFGRISKAAQTTVTVTPPAGKPVSGVLDRIDDFNVSLRDADGEYHAWTRTPALKVVVTDPFAAHIALLDQYTDKNIHDLTAYLETLK